MLIYYLKVHFPELFDSKKESWTQEDVANGLIDYCIVVEMVGFAIAHSFTFTYKEYLPGRLPEASSQHTDTPTTTTTSTVDNQQQNRDQRYCPPTTLEEPLHFRDALWSSTVPRETLHDIRRLRTDAMQDIRRIRTGIVEATLQRGRSGERQAQQRQENLSDEENQNNEVEGA